MKKFNKIQERDFRLMANNYELSYQKLLDLTNKISSHKRLLTFLMTEA